MAKTISKFDVKNSSKNSVTTKNVDILPHILDEPEQGLGYRVYFKQPSFADSNGVPLITSERQTEEVETK